MNKNVVFTLITLSLAGGVTYAYNYSKPVYHQIGVSTPIVATKPTEAVVTSQAVVHHAKPIVVAPLPNLTPPPDIAPPTSTPPPQPKTCNSYTAINPQGWPQTKEVCSDGTTTWR